MERKRKADIFLIATCACALIIPQVVFPLTHAAQEYDEVEQRPLSAFPDLSSTSLALLPEKITAWFNDHVPYRGRLKTLWGNAIYVLLHDTADTRVLVGKADGDSAHAWLFYNTESDGEPLQEAQGIAVYTEAEKEEMAANIAANEKTAAEYGFRLCYFSSPNKESVYFDRLPSAYEQYDCSTRLQKLISWLQTEKGYDHYVYPLAAEKEASEQYQTYYRQDIHWNAYGAYIGYRALMEELHPELAESFLNDYTVGAETDTAKDHDLLRLASLSGVTADQTVTVSFHEDYKVESETLYGDTVTETRCEQAPIDRTVMVIGDSFRTEMIRYLERTYTHCFFMHRDSYRTIMMDWLCPDEVVLESVERYAPDNMNVLLEQDVQTYPDSILQNTNH